MRVSKLSLLYDDDIALLASDTDFQYALGQTAAECEATWIRVLQV